MDSSLVPFEPWPLARRAAGLAACGGALAVAVNLEGFLCLVPREGGELLLYRVSEPGSFSSYSVASVFLHHGRPTALLYRDRFFIDSPEPSPDPRCLSVEMGTPTLTPAEIPAFAAYPASQSWDIESLTASADGRIFFRAVRNDAVAYASSSSLDEPSVEETAGSFRTAAMPRDSVPGNAGLARVLDAAARELPADTAKAATVCGAGAPFQTSYLLSRRREGSDSILASVDGEIERVWAYYDDHCAVLLYPDGAWLASSDAGGEVLRGSLPELPEGFAYTGVALLGPTAVALWEEQDGWSVGAAGFLLVNLPL